MKLLLLIMHHLTEVLNLFLIKFPEVTLISNNKNLGFGKANNQALRIAKGKYILLINPDTLVSEDTFTKMISFLRIIHQPV